MTKVRTHTNIKKSELGLGGVILKTKVQIDCKLAEFNRVYREVDKLYHRIARESGLSDSAFIILYSIRETDKVTTQKDICDMGAMSKQTINSALKKLERDGFIELKVMESNHKNKQLLLTEKGQELVEEIIDPVISGENKVFDKMAERSKEFLHLSRIYLYLLSEEFDKRLDTSWKEEE